MGTVRKSGGGFVREGGEHSLPSVLLSVTLSPRRGRSHDAVAECPSVCVPPAEDFVTSAAQNQRGESVSVINHSVPAEQTLVSRSAGNTNGSPVADPTEAVSTVSGGRLSMAPQSRMVETSCVDGVREPANQGSLSRRVVDTITEVRAPSTRRLYACKWAVFERWCESNGRDPENCPVSDILDFLQQRMDEGSMPSTLKVYVAAISAFHAAINGRSVGKHNLVIRFLRGARRLRPSRPPTVPSWDLALVLEALALPPFEPLQTVGLRELSLKTTLLLALASVKRVGHLQALSMNADCMQLDWVIVISHSTEIGLRGLNRSRHCSERKWWRFLLSLQSRRLHRMPLLIRCCAQYGLCEFTSTARLSFGSPSSYLYALEAALRGSLSPNNGYHIGWLKLLPWHIQAREWNVLLVSEPIRRGRLAPCGRGLRAVRSRIFVWRLDGLHRIPSPDFTIWTCGH